MSIVDFSAIGSKCKVELVGGHDFELTFRPFTLADFAWLQAEFTEEEALKIANLDPEMISRVIWNQLTNECKKDLSGIKFEKYNDDTGETETVECRGYENIFNSLKDVEQLLTAFACYSEVQNLNSFTQDEKKKKKTRIAR